jgi:hypothetical protein
MPALADNRVHVEGGAMPRLDDTAVEEGLQRLPGWERRGNQIAKTFVREDFEDVPRPVELWWRPIG